MSKRSVPLNSAHLSAIVSSPSALIVRPAAAAPRVLRDGPDLVLEVPLPWLAGPRQEVVAHGGPVEEDAGLWVMPCGDGLAGVALAQPGEAPYTAARTLYERLLARLGGHQLYRVWNLLPQINEVVNEVENYRAFNAGRHQAFLAAYGPDFAQRLSAASALGTPGNQLALCFLAGPGEAHHVENPDQVPAFQYPEEYGASPPSFARGTTVGHAGGQTWYLSGTASIKGHVTCGKDFAEQARLTFDNVALMFRRMGIPEGATGPWKVFLRQRRDLPAAEAALREAFPQAVPDAMFLEADICRRALLLEVEATLHEPALRSTNRKQAGSHLLTL